MKLKIKKEEFLKGLQRIQGVVEKKNTMPILSNMLLSAENGALEIIATDLEIGLRGSYAAEIERPGGVEVLVDRDPALACCHEDASARKGEDQCRA